MLRVRKFRANSCRVLFFSRGRGRGHAIPDHAIAAHLRESLPNLDIIFVSYSTGYRTLRDLGEYVVDLGFTENNPLYPTLVMAGRLIQGLTPDIVIAHEEFSVPPAAAINSTYNVFITDWFLEESSIYMQPLDHANAVLYVDDQPNRSVPSFLAHKIEYSGPVLRSLDIDSSRDHEYRRMLGIPDDATVITVIPGGATNSSEDSSPILGILVQAYCLLNLHQKRMIWISDYDYNILSEVAKLHPTIVPLRPTRSVMQLMHESDLVITKANRITTLEASMLGIRSLSLSHGTNPIDDARVARIPGHVALRVGDVDATQLARAIDETLTGPPPAENSDRPNGLDRAVDLLRRHSERAMGRRRHR